jgi:hypothetical protein
MSAAEIILRIGSGIGGWLVFIAHGLVLAVLPRADCDPQSDELWLGTLVLGALSLGGLVLVNLGLRWRHSLRWLAAPALALAVLAATGVAPAVAATTLAGRPLCEMTAQPPALALDLPASGLQRAWPIGQLVVLVLGCVQGIRYWRGPVEA